MSVDHATRAAGEMYDILAGRETIYIDEYGLLWTRNYEDREFTRKLTPEEFIRSAEYVDTVSYTHLTLPTIYSV